MQHATTDRRIAPCPFRSSDSSAAVKDTAALAFWSRHFGQSPAVAVSPFAEQLAKEFAYAHVIMLFPRLIGDSLCRAWPPHIVYKLVDHVIGSCSRLYFCFLRRGAC
jgi:hypothetical protein